MSWLSRMGLLALGVAAAWGSACGSGGGTTTTSGTGGDAGTGGAGSVTSTTGSTGGAPGTGGAGGVMCGSEQKTCEDGTCQVKNDPAFGCADPSCDPCVNEHGITKCMLGGCAPQCHLGWGDCDKNPKNGCEHDSLTDVANCGGCGLACAPGFACELGICTCNATDTVCDGGATPGSVTCPAVTGPDVCVCGGVTCLPGQRCVSDGRCG